MSASKLVRRRVIIREYDFDKVKELALTPSLYIVGDTLYNRVEFQPLNRDMLEKEAILYIMKHGDKRNPLRPVDSPSRLLLNASGYLYNNLYNSRYVNWHSWYDNEGYIQIQSRKNNPISRLGWGIFEKDT